MDLTMSSSWIERDFDVRVDHLEPVGLGADARADLHRVVATDGREYAAKSSTGPQPGLAVADLLASRGVPGVPRPVRSRAGGLTSPGGAAAEGRRLSLVPWVRGQRVLDVGMAPREWTALGELLGRLHTTPTDDPALAAVPLEGHDPAAVVAQARSLDDLLAAASTDHGDDPVVVEVARAWRSDGQRLLAVADAAARLADSPAWAKPSATPVLCHGDPHHGNLLVDPDSRVWLIDWDDAILAPREADLMFVVGGVFSHGPITSDRVRAFFDGYAPVTGVGAEDLDPELLAYLRAVRALVDVIDLLTTALTPQRHDLTSRREAWRYARGTLGPGGLVDLVLS